MQDFQGLSRQEWHQRYLAQARWTEHLQQYIFKKITPHPGGRILEVGSGTGVVLEALARTGDFEFFGVDLDYPSLSCACTLNPAFKLTQADGQFLPFPGGSFEVSLCHYLLMWVDNPIQILYEMRRVTRPGGWVLALAEPDHLARIDYPPPLDSLGERQTQALQYQGVDVAMGRKLRSLFHQTGLAEVEVGLLSAQWTQTAELAVEPTEWRLLRADLEDQLTEGEFAEYEQVDRQARQAGTRVLFIPTFYAIGKVPQN